MTGTGFGDRQAARRQLVMMAGTLVVVLVVINVIAIYGLDRIGREAESYAAVTERLIETTDLAREAQGSNPGAQRVRMALVAEAEECVEAALRIVQFIQSRTA